jgi:phosphoribosylformylglycinamidine cyclo-ligase
VRLDLEAIPVPPVFAWLARTGGVAAPEMLRTFNCGIGMVMVVARADVDTVRAALDAAGEPAVAIGEVTAQAEPRVATAGALKL